MTRSAASIQTIPSMRAASVPVEDRPGMTSAMGALGPDNDCYNGRVIDRSQIRIRGLSKKSFEAYEETAQG